MDDNPYESPVSTNHSGGGEVSPAMIESFRRTKGWVKLCGIVTCVISALILVAALFVVIGGGDLTNQLGAGGAPLAVIGIVYIAMAALYFAIGLSMLKYSGAIGRLLQSGSLRDAEEAVERQRSFWKLIGMITLIIVVIYGAIFVFGILAAVLAAV